MPAQTNRPRVSLEDLLLASETTALITKLERYRAHVRASLPDEILYTADGSPNLRNRYGAILLHIGQLTSVLRTFEESDHSGDRP